MLIADSTRRLIGDLFECRELAPVLPKGFHAAVRTHQVLGERTCESRFKALHGTQLTTLVGRRKELDLLFDRWGLAKGGEGQIVWLSGEPGIGVSAGAGAAAATRIRRWASAHGLPMLSRTHHEHPPSDDRSTGVCRRLSPARRFPPKA